MKNFILLVSVLFCSNLLAIEASTIESQQWWATWAIPLIGLVVLIIEFIIGKTTLVKANSILEVILNVVLKIGKALMPSK